MIKVDERTHARLVELAAQRSITIGGCVGELASAQRTHAEWEAIGQQANDYLREHFGFDPTPQERGELAAEHAAIMTDLGGARHVRRLIGLDSTTVGAMLRRLTERGLLERRGEKRGTGVRAHGSLTGARRTAPNCRWLVSPSPS